jgi:hypothetical protein
MPITCALVLEYEMNPKAQLAHSSLDIHDIQAMVQWTVSIFA